MTGTDNAGRYGLAAYSLDAYVPERVVDEMYDGRALTRMLVRKVRRRLPGARTQGRPEAVAACYAGITVFDRPEHHQGGLAFGRDVPRILNELGIGRCARLCEFCAGPGYIGYSLLASGWCETLALVEIDPAAVAVARRTAAHNGIVHRVAVHESDVLDAVPDTERWDVVVANPPHFLPDPDEPPSHQRFDADWDVHRRFYAGVKRHMSPGGVVVMIENVAGSDPDLFAQMIRAGGGEPREVHLGTDVHGAPNGLYCMVSDW